ncbi:MAG: tRNA guanosine(34) transglycosylase Tgt [Simkaniaceae bacterium]|nr:tRNA guanosine(34) transglycosylase Tgt [Simkaniaceae bacterium]
MSSFKFEVLHTSSKSRARVGRIHTPHGIIDTPNFVAVGTNGTVKALDNEMVSSIGLQLMFCNTYHLLLQPGPEVIEKGGGIHRFVNRNMPIITDSGGFQVFSLAYGSVADELKSKGTKKQGGSVVKITDDGVHFRSYRDGRSILLTPEISVATQKAIGADIIIPFDELPPYHISDQELKKSLHRTHAWEKRSLEAHLKDPRDQAMYAVIHGGVDNSLRKKSCDFLRKLPFNGFAIGGSIGKNKRQMVSMLSSLLPKLPIEAPNHLLGIADLKSLEACVPLGIDTFDSSYPTKAARHGTLLTSTGGIKITRGRHSGEFEPIEKGCSCYTCRNYSKAYIHHLFKANELTSMTLASIHNLYFMVEFMKSFRNHILKNKL